jgi:hyperosmotically inducible protein
MGRDLFCALSLSTLLLACAHDKTNRAAESSAHVETEHAEHHAQAEQDRDRELVRERELNALDQGNSEIDLDTTQRIRKAVMADDALSFSAKNVKIITRDGHVTLRGGVKTPEEKQAIGKHALGVAGASHVTNQLEVSP